MRGEGEIVSDASQGPGWWFASDGKWYPPYTQTAQPVPSFTPQATPGLGDTRRPRIWPGITALVAGTLCLVVGLVLFGVVGFAGLVGSPVYQAPVTVSVKCDIGDYYVYQHVGSQISGPGFSYSQSGVPTLTSQKVQVRGPEGAQVATWSTSGGETITKGSWIYVNTVGFHAARAGAYQVHIAAVSPSAVIVGPSLGSQFLRAAPWLIMVGVGGLVAIAGLVLLIVSLVRRNRQNRIPWDYGGPPGQWVTQTR
jgi:hypothetical protein